jgi:hypothetical protein
VIKFFWTCLNRRITEAAYIVYTRTLIGFVSRVVIFTQNRK